MPAPTMNKLWYGRRMMYAIIYSGNGLDRQYGTLLRFVLYCYMYVDPSHRTLLRVHHHLPYYSLYMYVTVRCTKYVCSHEGFLLQNVISISNSETTYM